MSAITGTQWNAGLLMAAAKLANNQTLSLAEEQAVAEVLTSIGAAGLSVGSGFPEGPAGDVQGWNGLGRTNWFNGRYLTAEALKRQDVYFDARSRLAAQALMPGIAWGLGVRGDTVQAPPVFLPGDDQPPRRNGFPADRELELQRGLAFDHQGRPILVAQFFRFTIEQLIGVYRTTPQRVVGGSIEFMPCVCLAPDPAGPSGGTAQVPSGPYLLVIEAAERPDGEAKVVDDLCAGGQPDTCRADAWRGGFGLSLVRFPVELPLRQDLRSVWDLRGTLSAYFFDVFEHPLWRRRTPLFATDDGFCAGTGSGRHDAAAVALAMLYLGEDGSVLFLDPWIPRRVICATPGEDWHRTRFGAPPRAAAWARIHQFQCMLTESLAREPLLRGDDDRPESIGLYDRGFRHIPPIGFLPMSPVPADPEREAVRDYLVSTVVADANRQAKGYFEDTNVLTYTVVALHDDDILEDLSNVFDKDPIQLARPFWTAEDLRRIQATAVLWLQERTTQNLWQLMAAVLRIVGSDELINRRTEIVKLVVPMQGLTRRHPLLGTMPEDITGMTAFWDARSRAEAAGTGVTIPGTGVPTHLTDRLRLEAGLDALPRQAVVYVKQRLVLLDLLFLLMDWLELLAGLVGLTQQQPEQGSTLGGFQLTTGGMRAAYAAAPQPTRLMAASALDNGLIQGLIARAAVAAGSDLAVPERNLAFTRMVREQELALAGEIDDPQLRRQAAVDAAADAFAAEYPDYQTLQFLASVQDADTTLALVEELAVAGGPTPTRTLADELAGDGPVIFADNDARLLYADMRNQLGARKVSELVPGAKTDLTGKELLSRSPAEAERILGTETYAKFREAFSAERTAATKGALDLRGGISEDLRNRLTAEIAAGRTGDEAVARIRNDASLSVADRRRLDGAATLLRISGGDLSVLNRIRRIGPR